MLNFNVDPYYDDFDPGNNFHRILFKPGRAVQARELTQSQTILQNQIKNFADHIFSQNTPVKGGKVTLNLNASYLKLETLYNDVDVVASDFLNQVITDESSQVVAKVIATEEATSTEPPTLIVTYFSGSEFESGNTVISVTSATVANTISTDATGLSSVASVSNGVYYIVNGYNYSSIQNDDGTYNRYSIGHFVEVQPQTIILEKYSATPNVRIGLDISEYISDYVSDPNLLDPAVGATNYQAPGADRFTIDLNLTTKSLTSSGSSDQNFVELMRVENGTIVKQVNETTYSEIDNYLAKRTYETNGDYVISEFKITPSANTDTNGGSKYIINVGPGVAYVQGFRAENQGTLPIDSTRARTTETINNNIVTPSFGNYLYVTELGGANSGYFDVTQSSPVDLHITSDISKVNTDTALSYASTLAASGYIRDLSYSDSGKYRAHFFALQNKVLTDDVSSATSTSVTLTDTNKFSITNDVYIGAKLTIDSGLGAGQTRTITDYVGATKVVTVDPAFSITPDNTSVASIRFGVKDVESVVSVDGSRNLLANAAVDVSSKVGGLATGDTYLRDTGNPEMIFPVGQSYVSSLSDTSYTSTQVFRSVSFGSATGGIEGSISTFNSSVFNFSGTGEQSADSVLQNYIIFNETTGDIMDFSGSGNTVTVSVDKQTATFFSDTHSVFTGTVVAKVDVIDADSTNYVRKTKTLVEADTATIGTSGTDVSGTKVDLTNAQVYIPLASNVVGYGSSQNLYVSDVKRIVKIINTKGETPSLDMLSDSSYDVTNNYNFDNGQRDGYYGHASISLKPGAPRPVALWVFFDYYATSGGDGYYSVNSYTNENYAEIPSYTASNGVTYELKDCIDFRPIVVNAQANFTFRYFNSSDAKGAFLPRDNSSFTGDYSFYLGRKDLLVITKDGVVNVIEGVPARNPLFPSQPSGSLKLAEITHDPYTAYVQGEASGVVPNVSVKPVFYKNWLMKDITKLQDRVNDLEYYTSLSLLEQQTVNLQVTDSLGLNRFKNGILVDDFSTFGVADTYNPSFSASIATDKKILTAAIDVKNYQLQPLALLKDINYGRLSAAAQSALNIKVHNYGETSVVTLPYVETTLVKQTLASRDYDVNAFTVRNNEGYLEITPPMDNWVDTQQEPSLLFVDPNLKTYKSTNSLNLLQVGDWQKIPGTEYSTSSSSVSGRTTTTVTNTYSDFTRNLYYGNYAETQNQTATYVTDVSLLPYIRGQQISFLARGLLSNTTMNAFFDEKRVTRLIKKPNIVNVTVTSGTFEIGDVIGYMSSGTSGTFTQTGKIVDIYKSSTTSYRLYVVDDNYHTAYSPTSTLVSITFSAAGVNTASPKGVATLVSNTHYSGTITGSTASNTNTVTLNSKASSTTNYYVGMTFNIVGGSYTGITSVAKGKAVTITAYNGSTKVATLSDNISYTQYDVYSIGNIVSNEVGNISGIFYLFGGYFPTGDRTLRFDNRIITQTATEFLYEKGTETTYCEAVFTAQGLAKKTQSVEYSPSIAAATQVSTITQKDEGRLINTSTSSVTRRSGCCVVATHLESTGIWSTTEKNSLVDWCEKYLHDKALGECFRRGYQVIGSKVGVPIFKGESRLSKYISKYFTWSWNNGTNMVQGKRFNPLSIPNSLLWITAFMAVGAVVSKEYATKSWKKLYE